jgi:hypothetical protein
MTYMYDFTYVIKKNEPHATSAYPPADNNYGRSKSMFGIVGILACMPIASAVIGAVAAAVSTTYGVYNANDTAEKMDAQAAEQKENMTVQEALAKKQNQKALVKAAQMAATGSLLDRIMTDRAEHKTREANKKLHRVDSSNGSIPRAERNFGTVAQSSPTIRS